MIFFVSASEEVNKPVKDDAKYVIKVVSNCSTTN